MTPDDDAWDDDRLAAAFAERARATSARADLTDDVIERVRSRSDRRTIWHPLRLATAAAVLVAVGLGAFAARTPPPPSNAGLIPSAAISELDDLGLSLMTASEAALVRDRDRDDRELAVHGLFRHGPAVPGLSCPPVLRSPVNPALPQLCGQTDQRIVEAVTGDSSGSSTSVIPGAPNGGPTAIRPLLPMLDQSALMAAVGRSDPSGVRIVAIGHFDDRRSILCGVDEQECRDTYVVDRLVAVDGAWVGPSTSLSLHRLEPGRVLPTWTTADVDLVVTAAAPAVRIVSRLAIPGERIFEVEPALGTGAHGIVNRQLVWLVNGLEPQPNQPLRVRTFLLVDGDPTVAYESAPWDVSTTGFVPFPLIGLAPEPTTSRAPSPTAVGTQEVDFPETWGGLPVRSVAEAIAGVPRLDDSQPEAVAIKGWYVPPDPTVACPAPQNTPVGPVEQPCPAGRHWLLDAPERLWDDPGPPWIDRQPSGPALNPIVPADVRFDLPLLWFDTGPSPLPVVVIGHFRDPRTAFGGNPNDLVVDALVWRAGVATANAPVGPVAGSLDDPLAVMIRVQRDVGSSIEAWLNLTSGAGLVADDPSGDPFPPELATAERVWVVRRLVEREQGGAAIERAYTADGSDRVWSSSLCCRIWLETKLLTALGGSPILETLDYPGDVVAIRPGLPEGAASWIEGHGPPETGTVMLGVIEGRPNELRIAWIGSECDRVWQLTWWANEVLLWPRERRPTCSEAGVRREVVVTLDHPVDLEAISVSNGGAGG